MIRFVRHLKNFANFRVITGTVSGSIMVLSIAWYLNDRGFEPAIAAIASTGTFLGLFQYAFLSFDKNLVADRIALVVGNKNYVNTPPLVNSISDAEAVCASLKAVGFKIIKRIDPSAAELRKAIYDFQTILSTGGVGLFYYAGHAAQINGRDYILPVDAHLSSRDEFARKAINLNDLLGPVDQIIEESPAHNGSIVIYSTASGSDALDTFLPLESDVSSEQPSGRSQGATAGRPVGKVPHSPFAWVFLSLVARWNLEIFDLFRELLVRVRKSTEATQIPWISASVDTEFYFKPVIKERIGILKILVFDACRSEPFYRPQVYYALPATHGEAGGSPSTTGEVPNPRVMRSA
jgi:hypothetical protein